MGAGTLGLALLLALAEPVSPSCSGTPGRPTSSVRRDLAWATVNYEQLTALFRVEERSLAFVSASLANVLITIGLTLLRRGPREGRTGRDRRELQRTLIVYLALLGYRREQLGLQFDRGLLREMNRFGLLRPDGALSLGDELLRPVLPRQARRRRRGGPVFGRRPDRVGDGAPAHGVPARMAGLRVLDRRRRRGAPHVRLRAHVPHRRHRLGRPRADAPVAVDRRRPRHAGVRELGVVGPLAFSTVAYGAYIVVAIGVGRARRTSSTGSSPGRPRRSTSRSTLR